MRVGFLGPGLAGCSTTIETLARFRGAAADWRDQTLSVSGFELRPGSGSTVVDYFRSREELIAWSDALVITLDVQPERLDSNREVLERFRTSLIGKPRAYQINKIDIRSGDWLLPYLPELGWGPRMDVVQTSMRHYAIPDAKPVGIEALWKAIERLDLASS